MMLTNVGEGGNMEKILMMLLEVSLSMTVLILLMLLLKSLFNKRYGIKMRYFIWLFIVIRLVLPFNISFPKAIDINTPQNRTVFIIPDTKMVSHPEGVLNQDFTETNLETKELVIEDSKTISLFEVMFVIWISVLLITLIYQIIRYSYYSRMVSKSSVKCDNHIQMLLSEIEGKYQYNTNIQVYQNEFLPSPMLIGFIHPKIIITEVNLTDKQIKMILEHEFVHYKRHDLLFKVLILITRSLHWFNPFVYLMEKEIDKDIEFSCDEEVLKGQDLNYRKEYGNTILSLIKSNTKKQTSILTTSFSSKKKNIKERFITLADTKKKSKGVQIIVISLLLIAVTTSLVSCSNTLKINDVVTKIENDNRTVYKFFNEIELVLNPSTDDGYYYIDDFNLISTNDYDKVEFAMNFKYDDGAILSTKSFITKTNDVNQQLNIGYPDQTYFNYGNYAIGIISFETLDINRVYSNVQYKLNGTLINDDTLMNLKNICTLITPIDENNLDVTTFSTDNKLNNKEFNSYYMSSVDDSYIRNVLNGKISLKNYELNQEVSKECGFQVDVNRYNSTTIQVSDYDSLENVIEKINKTNYQFYGINMNVNNINTSKIIVNEDDKFNISPIEPDFGYYYSVPNELKVIDGKETMLQKEDITIYETGVNGISINVPANYDPRLKIAVDNSNGIYLYYESSVANTKQQLVYIKQENPNDLLQTYYFEFKGESEEMKTYRYENNLLTNQDDKDAYFDIASDFINGVINISISQD